MNEILQEKLQKQIDELLEAKENDYERFLAIGGDEMLDSMRQLIVELIML